VADTPVSTAPAATPESEPSAWLVDLPDVPEADEELELPAWMSDLSDAGIIDNESKQLDLPTAEDVELLGRPENLAESFAADVELELPAWMSDLSEAPETLGSPMSAEPPAEPEQDMPDWLTREVPPEAGAEEPSAPPEIEIAEEVIGPPELPDSDEAAEPAALLSPAEPAPEANADLPPWLAELPQAPDTGALTQPVAPSSQAESETPEWLAQLPAAPTEPDSEEPLAKGSSEPTLPDESEAPSQSAEKPRPPNTGALLALPDFEVEEEAEPPIWLADLSRDIEAEADLDMPSGLTGSSEPTVEETEAVALEPEVEEELDMPAWLNELPAVDADDTTIQTPAEDDLEIPGWLGELPEPVTEAEPAQPEAAPRPTEAEDIASADEAEEEIELPDWLGDSGELTETDEPAESETATVQPEAEDDIELPDWLTGSVELTETQESAAQAEADIEAPDWLAELPEGAETEETPPQAEARAEVDASDRLAEPDDAIEMPSWLAELPGADETDETFIQPPAKEDLESPSWLAELPEADHAEEDGSEPAAGEAIEMPVWLTGTDEAEEADEATPQPEAAALVEPSPQPVDEKDVTGADEAIELPGWLSETAEAGEAPPAPAAAEENAQADAEIGMPVWLIDTTESGGPEEGPAQPETDADLELPNWLTDTTESVQTGAAPDQGSTKADLEADPEASNWLADLIDLDDEDDLEPPDWLTELPKPTAVAEAAADTEAEAELDAPDWLSDAAEEMDASDENEDKDDDEDDPDGPDGGRAAKIVEVDQATDPSKTAGAVSFDEEPEAPDWLLKNPDETVSGAGPGTRSKDEPEAPDWLTNSAGSVEEMGPSSVASDLTKTDPSPTDRPNQPKGSRPAGQASGPQSWIAALKTPRETPEDDNNPVAEATGVLAGLTGLLPAEKVEAGPPMAELGPVPLEGRQDAVRRAAQEFYAIATQVRQPATVPAPLTGQAWLVSGVVRTILYLLFIGLIAIPLLPGMQKVDAADPDQAVPWTEPVGSLNEVLDKQRRDMIGHELGIIDLQQPDSVALVSFDFTAATQGEMDPLARAVIGRLLGQGMRLIAVSLEPEGAALAQATLDDVLADRGEDYGAKVINLGYLPGRVTAIRELASGQKSLAGLTDYKEGLTFASNQRTGWQAINNLGQVDLIVTITDNPTTARWWVEQMEAAGPTDNGDRSLLAVTSAIADPFLRPYRDSDQLNGLLSGINGAAAVEAARNNFGPARQMLDSQSIAHLLIIILIAAGTVAGWMPAADEMTSSATEPSTNQPTSRNGNQPD
jgi:hypothetical protein